MNAELSTDCASSPLIDPMRVLVDIIEDVATHPTGRWSRLRSGERDDIHPLTRRLVLARDNYRCTICSGDLGGLHIDHVLPWSCFGADTSDNLRVLCADHNLYRSNRLETYLPRIVPVTVACDHCLNEHDELDYYRHRWPRAFSDDDLNCPLCWDREFIPGSEHISAYCGTCTITSWVSDSRRLG